MAGEIPSNARPVFITANVAPGGTPGVGAGESSGSTIINTALGLIPGLESRHVLGANPDIDIASAETIWAPGGAVVFPTVGAQLKISSTDNGDTGSVKVIVLDDAFNETTVIVALTGQTPVNVGPALGFRINCLELNDQATLTGDVYCYSGTATAGLPDDLTKVLGLIEAPSDVCLSTVFTVPAGKIGLIPNIWCGENSRKAATILANAFYQEVGQKPKDLTFLTTAADGNNQMQQFIAAPRQLPAGTDIWVNASTDINDTAVACAYDIFLADV